MLTARVNVPYIDVRNYSIARDLLELIPRHIVEEHQVLPISRVGNKLTVALEKPRNNPVVDDIHLLTGFHIKAVRAGGAELRLAIQGLWEAAPRPSAEPADRPALPGERLTPRPGAA